MLHDINIVITATGGMQMSAWKRVCFVATGLLGVGAGETLISVTLVEEMSVRYEMPYFFVFPVLVGFCSGVYLAWSLSKHFISVLAYQVLALLFGASLTVHYDKVDALEIVLYTVLFASIGVMLSGGVEEVRQEANTQPNRVPVGTKEGS